MTEDTKVPPTSSSIEDTLAQRGSAYGDFREQGRITQNLKRAMQDSPNWSNLDFPTYMKEGLDMIQHKVSRMLNGDALYDDNMHDIIGYCKLMQDRAKQDRDNGVTFQCNGDKMYPKYKHEGLSAGVDEGKSAGSGYPVPDILGGLARSSGRSKDVSTVYNELDHLRSLRDFAHKKGCVNVTISISDLDNLLTSVSKEGK